MPQYTFAFSLHKLLRLLTSETNLRNVSQTLRHFSFRYTWDFYKFREKFRPITFEPSRPYTSGLNANSSWFEYADGSAVNTHNRVVMRSFCMHNIMAAQIPSRPGGVPPRRQTRSSVTRKRRIRKDRRNDTMYFQQITLQMNVFNVYITRALRTGYNVRTITC